MLDLMQSKISSLVIYELRLLSIMTPILQALIAVAVGVLLGFLLLGEMPLVIGGNFAHVIDVVLVISGWVFLGILLQDLDNLTTTADISTCWGLPQQLYLSCPTLSPERVS